MKNEGFNPSCVPVSCGADKTAGCQSGSAFYLRLALSNMKKNGNIYFPYLLAGGLLSGLYYIVLAVGEMVADSEMKGGPEMMVILQMCAGLCIVIMFLILFYINSFVMKRRNRELGLYCILGMGKRHLSVLLFWEVLVSAAISIAGGILFGVLFSQLLFLVLLKLVQIPAKLTFAIPFASVGKTLAVFGIGYFVTYLYDLGVIHRTDPINLLRSRQEGEREPKTKLLTALFGAVTLAAGYGIALKVKTVSEGIFLFFPAAFLVIIATYCLFLAGSIVFLKFLRSQKGFYYRPENFISVSGMLYRMKQNAAGLATIAILSTALLVVLSSTVTLYAGEEGMLKDLFPREYKAIVRLDDISDAGQLAELKALEEKNTASLHALAKETGTALLNDYGVFTVWRMAEKQENHFDGNVPADRASDIEAEKTVSLTLISLEDYNAMTGSGEALLENQVIYISPELQKRETVSINGEEFSVKQQLQKLEDFPNDTMNQYMFMDQDKFGSYIVVLQDRMSMLKLRSRDGAAERLCWYYLFDLEGEIAAQELFWEQTEGRMEHGAGLRVNRRSREREFFYELYGSLLFVGLLFVCLFLLATALIIYYKQVTEGYDDRERFLIMEKVGMRDAEIRRTIRKQVLIVFFLPLVTAIVHICVAARVLRMFLVVLGLTSTRVFWSGMTACCLIFGLVYFMIYRLTSRVYFRIVSTKLG